MSGWIAQILPIAVETCALTIGFELPTKGHSPGIDICSKPDFLLLREGSCALEFPAEELLEERIKDICGVDRAGSNVQSNIGEAMHIAIRRKEIERRRKRNFLWKAALS